MRELRKAGLALCVAMLLLAVAGFTPGNSTTSTTGGISDPVAQHIQLLKSGKPQQKAAAAYWLGQQRSAAAVAIDPLLDLLGDITSVDAKQYRQRQLDKMTLGEEVAAALVNIGHPSIEPLIRVLKSSPQPEARKNAAWALGALHDIGATANEI
jgi:HEAT repeat protein